MQIKEEIIKFLNSINMPGQYIGGEYGSIVKNDQSNLSVAISFPDLYEIGMSNLAIRLIYNILNKIRDVTCERVFAPAQDFEELLRRKGIPLYTLETGKPLFTFDIIGFSIGYELTITNLLNILDLGKISYLREERGENDPIILVGGPVVANPLPFSKFIDAAFIGEAEAFFQEIFPQLAQFKKKGAKRSDLLELLFSHPSIWSPILIDKKVKKSIWRDFTSAQTEDFFPVPSIKIIQGNGNVEIMRGCPNGCRFCHAGILYRPVRMKLPQIIATEIHNQIFHCGYREITLSSLSTGDYKGIDQLINYFANRYKKLGVSFSLPSLRINSLSLDILDQISEVRKSGLTFAIETPETQWQIGINKEVSKTRIVDLLNTAKQKGWRTAKFYFMIGLPVYDSDESENIINYIQEINKQCKMNLNINISTFIPKPHTAFQWASQITENEALSRIKKIKSKLTGRNYKIGYHSPFASMLEGLISRGDERVGVIIIDAFQSGARFDSWDEFLNREVWNKAFSLHDNNAVLQGIYKKKEFSAELPWDKIDIGVRKDYLINECKKSFEMKLTEPCQNKCALACGICNTENKMETNDGINFLPDSLSNPEYENTQITKVNLLISFSKKEEAVFLSHLNCISIFEQAFMRAGYLIKFTEGFNPKPKMEFAHPLSLGILSEEEILNVEIANFDSEELFLYKMRNVFPKGFQISKVKIIKPYILGNKKKSLTSLFWGSDFKIQSETNIDIISMLSAKINNRDYFQNTDVLTQITETEKYLIIRWKYIEKKGFNILSMLNSLLLTDPFSLGIIITRISSLAKGTNNEPLSYFEAID